MAVNAQCIPVAPGGECPSCGWKWNSPEHTEPHPVLAHGGPKAPTLGKCANCDEDWNLDAVKCSHCHWEPTAMPAFNKLRDEKNKARKTQFSPPLPVREDPVKVHGEKAGIKLPEPAKAQAAPAKAPDAP